MTAIQPYWQQLDCPFEQVETVFDDCMTEALATLSDEGIATYIDAARFLGKMGRGAEPILAYLEDAPAVAAQIGEPILAIIKDYAHQLSRSPNGKAIEPFLKSLPAASRRLQTQEQLQYYMDLVIDMMQRTSISIHGIHLTMASPGLITFLEQVPKLLKLLSIEGLKNWVEYGIRHYDDHPERQIDYFSLQSADSRAILQRERHGTLFADVERKLNLYLRSLWMDDGLLVPYSLAFDEMRKPQPYYDQLGIRVPDVYDADDKTGVPGIDRYRALLAHIAAHRRWSSTVIADNYSPFQRLAVDFFEDARVEHLAMQDYPGLRRLFLALHPTPVEGACNPEQESCLRHRLAMLSRAILDPNHNYQDPDICDFTQRFHALMQQGESSTREMADLALAFVTKTRRQSDQLPKVYFTDTEIDYRDDNRNLWQFIEEGDEEEMFDERRQTDEEPEPEGLPPRHYPEWDYNTQSYRPDWTSVYESLHPSGNAAKIDELLAKHSALAKRLKQMFELLKPQNYVRIRYQEEGSELDLDVALRSLIDFKSGAQPDPRINMSHKHDNRDIAVMVLLDLSASLGDKAAGSQQTILELSQEAVSLLSWVIDGLGDPLAIAGFHSNTRHEVRYQHIKGFSEKWDDSVKARLAAMEAGYSTRMGAAMRHAAHYLGNQQADKKLLLILTDGEPADVDTRDQRLLIEDAHKAVQELSQDNIFSYCINLDPKADDYVADIFGNQYTIIDKVERLPEKLPKLFMALTS